MRERGFWKKMKIGERGGTRRASGAISKHNTLNEKIKKGEFEGKRTGSLFKFLQKRFFVARG